VESLSGDLASMLSSRQLDLAVLFETGAPRRWSVLPLVDERLFLIGLSSMPELQPDLPGSRVHIAQLGEVPLVLPSGLHGLRAVVDAAFARVRCEPRIVMEVDGLAVLMDAVRAGIGATIQPGAAIARLPKDAVAGIRIADRVARRVNLLASLSDDELAPAGLAARVVLRDVAGALIENDLWPGATLHEE
jgi:LysR family tcuABC transcriptional regulator